MIVKTHLNIVRAKLILAFCAILVFGAAQAQISTFTSNVASGNWNNPASWSEVGSDVDDIPDADDIVIILSGHNISLNGAQSADQVTINNGGTLTATGGSLTITTSMTVDDSGNYVHAINGGTIPTADWHPNSNCRITGVTTTAPLGLDQLPLTPPLTPGFGNFEWNTTIQSTNVYLESDVTIKGNFTVSATGGSFDPTNLALRMSNTTTGYTIDVGGNVTINGNSSFKMNNNSGICQMDIDGDLTLNSGNFTIVTGPASSTVTVLGDVSVLGGNLLLQEDNNGGVIGTLLVAGDFTHTGGTINETDAGGHGQITFNKAGIQTYTSGGTVTGDVRFTVNNASTLQMASPLTTITGGGSFTLASGATLGVTATDGITVGGTGNIQVTTRIYSTGANYIYNGSADQAVGDGLTQNTPANITIDNLGNTVSLGAATALTGNLTIANGTLDTNGNTVTFNGGGAQQINGTAASQAFDNIVVNKGGGALTVTGGINTITAANYTQTAGDFTAPATFSASGNVTLTAGTFTAGADTNVGGNWTNNGGTFTPGANTVTFDGGGAQAINGTTLNQTFNNIVVNKGGGTLSAAGLTSITATNFTLSAGSYTAPATATYSGNALLSAGT